MTASIDVFAAVIVPSGEPYHWRTPVPEYRRHPLGLLLNPNGPRYPVLWMQDVNGQRFRVRLLPEARRWRPHDCNRFTALPDIRHLIPAATRGHRRIAVRLRNGRTCHGEPSGFVWTSCGSATIKGWRPA